MRSEGVWGVDQGVWSLKSGVDEFSVLSFQLGFEFGLSDDAIWSERQKFKIQNSSEL